MKINNDIFYLILFNNICIGYSVKLFKKKENLFIWYLCLR